MPKGKKTDYSDMRKALEFESKNAWQGLDESEVDEFSKAYVDFMSKGKTERTFSEEAINLLEKNGYKSIEKVNYKDEVKAYYLYRGKALAIYKIPQKFNGSGLNVIASHIDSPRIDLKPKPIYEDSNMVLAKTHYYGGIKKYQWFNIPLAIVGVVAKSDGSVVKVNVGSME